MGKLIGIGLAGLTQLGIWAIVGAAVSVYALPASPALSAIQVSPAVFVYFVVYFILGFLFFSSVFSVIGAVCSTDQDAQQLQGIVTMIMAVPLLCLMLVLQSPNGAASVILSLIPVFTPTLMLARIIVVEPATWEIVLSIAMMILAIYASVLFSSRVFRVGILMHGKRPNLREILRWYRYSS